MAFKLANRTRQYITSTGAIDVAAVMQLGGVTNIDLNTFVSSVGDNNQTIVCVISGNGVDWQECVVTVDDAATDTLTVNTIIQSSISGTIGVLPITLTGTSRVFGIIPTQFETLFDLLFGGDPGVLVRSTAGVYETMMNLEINSSLIEEENSAAGSTFAIDNYADSQNSTTTSFPFMATRNARGTKAASLSVIDGSKLGGYGFYGWEGGNWRLGASIQVETVEDWTGSARGTQMLFSVIEPGTTTPIFPLVLTSTTLEFLGSPVGGGITDIANASDVTITSLADNDILVNESSDWVNRRPSYTFGFSAPQTAAYSASQVIGHHRAAAAITIGTNFASYLGLVSQAGGSAVTTASTVFSVEKAASATPNTFAQIGTITFAIGTVTPTFATASGAAQNIAAGDVIRIVAPASPDATFAGFYASIIASRQ